MKLTLLIALALATAAGSAFAAEIEGYSIKSINTTFDVQPDNTVIQTTYFLFDRMLSNGSLSYTLDEEVKSISARAGARNINYTIKKRGESYRLEMLIGRPINNLTLSYRAQGAVFTSENINHFFTALSYEKPVGRITVTVKLPPAQIIYNRAYLPQDAKTSSDGKRILLEWNRQKLTNSTFFSVKYQPVSSMAALWMIIPGLLFASAASMTGLYIHFRRRTSSAFLTGFRDDEQKTISYLRENKVVYQNRLHSEFNFSRAKATRIIMKLEEKGLVTKEKHGRTNKVTWLK